MPQPVSPGRRGYWVWSKDGTETGRIGYHTTERHFVLDYKVRVYGGDWETITQSIPLTYADCHYGGTRPYFRCNGIVRGRHCTRRVGKVFAGGAILPLPPLLQHRLFQPVRAAL